MSDEVSDPLLRLSEVTGAMGEVVKRFEREGWFERHDRAGLRVLVDAMVTEVERTSQWTSYGSSTLE